jgi:trimeric autotransporter adhesin
VTIAVVVALVPLAALAEGAGPAAARAVPAKAGTISTSAGGTGGPAKATTVGMLACGVASAGGKLLIAGGHVVQKVSPADWLTTVAGTGAISRDTGGLPDHALGGPALTTWVDTCGVAADHAGNLLIADVDNMRVSEAALERILVVPASTGTFYGQAMKAGDVYGVAGDGTQGAGGSGVRARQTELSNPRSVAVDRHGNLVIADSGFVIRNGPFGESVVRVAAATTGTFYGRAMKAGDIYTVAGRRNGEGYSGDGGPATKAALGDSIENVQVDPAGNILVANDSNNVVRVAAARSGTFYGQAMTAGDIYTVAGDGMAGYSGDGGPATSAELSGPAGVAVDAAGNAVIADTGNGRIRVVAARTGSFYGHAMTAGHIYTVAGDGMAGYSGDGGPATSAELSGPAGVAVDAAGNLAIADTGNGRIRVVAARTGSFYGRAMTAGHIYTVAGGAPPYRSGQRATRAELDLGYFGAVAADAAGNTVIAAAGDERILVAAASTGTFYGRTMTTGDIYIVAGNGTAGYSGDGGPATKAELRLQQGVTVDAAGNLVIPDTGNQRIRVVASRTGTFYGQPMTAGDIYTVAGDGTSGFSGDSGPATKAELQYPAGVSVDAAGNLLIADSYNQRIRVVASRTGTFYGQPMTAGDIYTVAGDGTAGYSGDGGPATSAGLFYPRGVTVDAAGNLVIADNDSLRIRVVAASSGTFYGQPMTAGDIYTVAGNGRIGFSGDGGPATSAELDAPCSVAVGAAGALLIADSLNNRIRVVTGGP